LLDHSRQHDREHFNKVKVVGEFWLLVEPGRRIASILRKTKVVKAVWASRIYEGHYARDGSTQLAAG
jgi:hypothetical protein